MSRYREPTPARARRAVAPEGKQRGALETAAAVVGLFTGVVAVMYLLGGLVIALRMLRDDFSAGSTVAAVAQLPRETVVTTALLEVILVALLVGVLLALYHGARNRPQPRRWPNDNLDEGPHGRKALYVIGAVAVLFGVAPAVVAWRAEGPVFAALVGLVIAIPSYALIAAGWYALRRIGRKRWSRLFRAAAGGAIWALLATLPAAALASFFSFDDAQICIDGTVEPVRGKLIGEGGGQILLEQHFDDEASVVSFPTDEVTRTEYGDLITILNCPVSTAEASAAGVAEAALDGHGGGIEVELAKAVRPYLYFDSRERWRPIDVGAFLEESFEGGGRHEVCELGNRQTCELPAGLVALKHRRGARSYLDIYGEPRRPESYASPNPSCRTKPPTLDCNGGPHAAFYYRRTTHDGRWYWDFWWFMRFNEYRGPFDNCNKAWCSDHEGDWEGVTVVTTAAQKPRILGAIYAAHNKRVLVDARYLPLADGHPVAYVAAGTHAGYPFRCYRKCKQYPGWGGFRLPETQHNGAVPWGANDDAMCTKSECVRPLPEVGEPSELALPLGGDWAGWRGLWGETCGRHRCRTRLVQASPRAPGEQVRFKCPWAVTDIAVPFRGDIGLADSEKAGDAKRLRSFCASQRGGL